METIEEKYIKLKTQRYEAIDRYNKKNKDIISARNNKKYTENKDEINRKRREKYQQFKNSDEWKLKNRENAKKYHAMQKEKLNFFIQREINKQNDENNKQNDEIK
jgi:hypothetical protein